MPKSFPNQYADNNVTSTGLVGVGFGFNAAYVRVVNGGAGPTYLNFGSTSVGSTNGFQVSSGETFNYELTGVPTAGLTAAATSTACVLRLWAIGQG